MSCSLRSFLRPSHFHAIGFLVFLALPKWGASAIEPVVVTELKPIDVAQQNLRKTHRSKQARVLKLAYDALQKKNYRSAVSLATRLQANEDFSDYGYWISATAVRELAQESIEKKKFLQALTLAKKAVTLNLEIERKAPFSPFLKNVSREIAQAELIMGEAFYGQHKWIPSQRAFESALQRTPSPGLDSESLIHYAEACKRKSTEICSAWIQKLSMQVPKQSFKELTKLFPQLGDKGKTPRNSIRTTTSYKAPDLDQTAFDSAMKLYLAEKYSDASKNFQQFLDDFPRSSFRFKARYWLAQSFIHQHDSEKASKVLADLQAETPLSLYGILSSRATGKPLDSMIDGALPMAIETDPFLSPQELFHLKKAQQFIAEGALELASYELKEIRARDALSSPFLVYLAMLNYTAQNHSTGFQVITELIQRKYEGIFSTYGLRLIFPVQFLEVISKYSNESSVDPILILSLIKQESAFAKNANSSAGAMGLMQLMPSTAFETDSSIKTADLAKEDVNIRVGITYLKKLLLRYNGNIVYALAGYNAGPNAVDRWLKEPPAKRGMLEFIESIPYRETREYVSSIIRNYFWYSRVLTGSFTKDINYFWNSSKPAETSQKPPVAPNIKPQNENA